MKLRWLPKTLTDCIAYIVDLANETEELKKEVKELREWKSRIQDGIRNIK